MDPKTGPVSIYQTVSEEVFSETQRVSSGHLTTEARTFLLLLVGTCSLLSALRLLNLLQEHRFTLNFWGIGERERKEY
jgi:hypothetical protein